MRSSSVRFAAASASFLFLAACAAGGGTTGGGGGSGCVLSFTGPEIIGQEFSLLDSVSELAESFALTSASAPADVQLRLKAIGTPTGNILVTLQADSSGQPGPIQSEAATLSGATITPGAADAFYTFTFPTPAVTLAAGTYWIVLRGSSAFSSTNGIDWMGTNATSGTPAASVYTGGTVMFSNNTGGTWTASGVSGRAFLFLLGC